MDESSSSARKFHVYKKSVHLSRDLSLARYLLTCLTTCKKEENLRDWYTVAVCKVGETVGAFELSSRWKLNFFKNSQEKFCGCQYIHENHESFPQWNFCIIRYFVILLIHIHVRTYGVVTVIHEILCLICMSEFFLQLDVFQLLYWLEMLYFSLALRQLWILMS